MRRLGRGAYTALLYLLLPLVLGRLAWVGSRNRAYWRRVPERFGLAAGRLGRVDIWLHAVSVGEVQAAVPLVAALRRGGGGRILVTTTTPTGSAAVRARFGDTVAHSYMPYDYPAVLRRFLALTRPRLVVLMETELWPNLVAAAERSGIPVALVNARLSARGAARYARLPALVGEMVARLDWVAAQAEADASRLIALGASPSRVAVTGSVKFDQPLGSDLATRAAALRRRFGPGRPVWIAASTHEGEEEAVLLAHRRLIRRHPRALLVLAPRHPERRARVTELLAREGFGWVAHSDGQVDAAAAEVYVVDTLGELPGFYAAADIAFVAGSLVPVGGHNVLEPAALGVPVLTGPEVRHFADIVGRLAEAGGLRQVADADQLGEVLCEWFADPAGRAARGEAARAFVEANRGATERVAAGLLGLLDRQPAR